MALPVRLIHRIPKLTIAALVLLVLATFSIQSHPDGLDGLIAFASADEGQPVATSATASAPVNTPADEVEKAPQPNKSARYGKPAEIEHLRIQHEQLQAQLDQLRRLESALEKQRRELQDRLTPSDDGSPRPMPSAEASGVPAPGFVPQLRAVEALVNAIPRKTASSSQQPDNTPKHLVASSTFTLVRSVYKVPATKAATLAAFLEEHITAEVEVELKGPVAPMPAPSGDPGAFEPPPSADEKPAYDFLAVQVTAPAEVQEVVSDLIGLMQGSDKRPSKKTSVQATPNYFPTNTDSNF